MNRYPLWRYLLVALVIAAGVLYALPNIYGSDPALQISARRGQAVDEALRARVEAALDDAGHTRLILGVHPMLPMSAPDIDHVAQQLLAEIRALVSDNLD